MGHLGASLLHSVHLCRMECRNDGFRTAHSESGRHPTAAARSCCCAVAARSGWSHRPARRAATARGPHTTEGRHNAWDPRPQGNTCPEAMQSDAAWPGGLNTACPRQACRKAGAGNGSEAAASHAGVPSPQPGPSAGQRHGRLKLVGDHGVRALRAARSLRPVPHRHPAAPAGARRLLCIGSRPIELRTAYPDARPPTRRPACPHRYRQRLAGRANLLARARIHRGERWGWVRRSRGPWPRGAGCTLGVRVWRSGAPEIRSGFLLGRGSAV